MLLSEIDNFHVDRLPHDAHLRRLQLVRGGVVNLQLSAFADINHCAIGDGLDPCHIPVMRRRNDVRAAG